MTFNLTSQFNSVRQMRESENTILLGQNSESISGLQDRVPTANSLHQKDGDNQKERNKNTTEFLNILEIMHASIERLANAVEEMEASFRERDGEEWREKLALRILGEDDIPQRHEGESMGDYRDRMETLLIEELLNGDGSIKDEYKNDPELSEYAQWAQKQYHLNSAREAVTELQNTNTTSERRTEILDGLEQRSNLEELTFADRDATPQSTTQSQIKDSVDAVRDIATETERSASVGLKFTS